MNDAEAAQASAERAQDVADDEDAGEFILVRIEGHALAGLLEHIGRAERTRAYRVRIAVDDGQLKVKQDEYVWSPPLGHVSTGEDAQ